MNASRFRVAVIAWAALTIVPAATNAQQDTVQQSSSKKDTAQLAPVVVTVTRGQSKSILRSPFALTVVQPDSSRPGQRHTSLDETLAEIPGLTVTSRNNPAQDPRLSMRGFGSRSAFGVRGVRVLRDGMPLTLPDGQTPLDYLSLESVGRVEVMRGAASAIYGNASGGVVDIRTAAPPLVPFSGKITQFVGDNRFSRTAAAAGGTAGPAFYQGDFSALSTEGIRAHSRQREETVFARGGISIGATDLTMSLMGLDNPVAQNPGALTASELATNPNMADALSVRRDARKAVHQIQIGIGAARPLGTGEVSALLFGGSRSLDNPLTFSIVEVGRHSYGGSAHASQSVSLLGAVNAFAAGVDLQSQNDLRRNYATCADTVPLSVPTATCPSIQSERGVVTLDQRELVSSAGFYLTDDISLGDKFGAMAGIRADNVAFEVKDRLITATNPDDSGNRTLRSVTPVVGAVMRVTPAHSVYANVAGAFETPTATELGNHPDGSAGINQDLNPQRSTTTEIGAKGFVSTILSYDLAAYSTRVRDELVPYEIAGSNGRRYFRNAGRTSRKGVEAGAQVRTGILELMAAYTYSDFKFVNYRTGSSVFDGNAIPGVPRHRWQGSIRAGGSAGYAVLEGEAAGKVQLDDANSQTGPGYAVTNMRFGTGVRLGSSQLSLSAGVQNLFDRHYAASIAVNAARGKYYEPASTRNFFFGISISAARARSNE